MIEPPKDSDYIAGTKVTYPSPKRYSGGQAKVALPKKRPQAREPRGAEQAYLADSGRLATHHHAQQSVPLVAPHLPAPTPSPTVPHGDKRAAQSSSPGALNAPCLQAVRDRFPALWAEISQNRPKQQPGDQGRSRYQLALGPEQHIGVNELEALVLKSLFSRPKSSGDDLFTIINLVGQVFPAGKGPSVKFIPKLLQWLCFDKEQLHLLEVIKLINRHMDGIGAAQVLIEEFCVSVTEASDLAGTAAVCHLLNQFLQLNIKHRRSQTVVQNKIYETFAVHRKRSLKERWLLLNNLTQLSAKHPDEAMTLELFDQLATLCLRSSGPAEIAQRSSTRDLHTLQELSDPCRDQHAHQALWFTLRYSFGSLELAHWVACASFVLKQTYLGNRDFCENVARSYVVHRASMPQRMRLAELIVILQDELVRNH